MTNDGGQRQQRPSSHHHQCAHTSSAGAHSLCGVRGRGLRQWRELGLSGTGEGRQLREGRQLHRAGKVLEVDGKKIRTFDG